MGGMLSALVRSSSRFGLVAVLLLAGCGTAVAQRPASRVSPDTAQVAVVAKVNGRPIDSSAMPSPVPPNKIGFDAMSTHLRKACPLSEDDPSNIGMKEAAAAQIACLERAAVKERAAFFAALPPTDPRAVRAAQVDRAFTAFVKDVCWASEEAQWVDFTTGARDDGTLRGFATLDCELRAVEERAFFFRALRTKDVMGFARHVDDAAPRGHREAVFLKDLTAAARDLESKPAPKAKSRDATRELGGSLTKTALREYVTRFVAIDHAAGSLAKSTCAAFDGLADALGEKTCATRTKTAYLALGAFESSGEDVGP